MWVNIEIKNDQRDPDFDPDDRVAVEVLAALAERGAGRWLLSCFRLRTVDRCRLLDPSGADGVADPRARPGTIEAVASRGHTAIHPWEPAVTAEQVERCHEAGILVNAWTCNDPDRFVALAAAGVDGIVTDVPDVMIAALDGSSSAVSLRLAPGPKAGRRSICHRSARGWRAEAVRAAGARRARSGR